MGLQEYPSKSFLVVLGAIALILAVALVFSIRIADDNQSDSIVEQQNELSESAERRAEEELIVESDPEKILRAQKAIISTQNYMARRGDAELTINEVVQHEQNSYKRRGYPSDALEIDVARQAVTEHLREEYSSASSDILRSRILDEALSCGISADDISLPASEDQMAKTESAVRELVDAPNPRDVQTILEQIKPVALSNEELVKIVEIIPQLDASNAIPVIEFLAPYRDRKPCAEFLDVLSKSDNMKLLKQALDSLGGSRAQGVEEILIELLQREDAPDDIRLAAVFHLTQLARKSPADTALVAELNKGSEQWQAAVVETMGQSGFGWASPLLMNAVMEKARTGSDEITRAAIVALANLARMDTDIVNLFVDIAEDENRSVEVRAMALLVAMEHPIMVRNGDNVIRSLEIILRSRDTRIRQIAESILLKMREEN